MNALFETFKPEGFSNLNTYLFADQPELLISFLKQSFDAEEKSRSIREDTNELANCILKIGDTCFMISQASGVFSGMRTCFYLYVSDVDLVYKRAIRNGAKSVFEAANMDYGDRQAGVEDPFGNYWWISERLVQSDY